MITCCEIAITLAVSSSIVILSLLAMFFNYNLKLDARTLKLEKKNGHETEKIKQLQQELDQLKKDHEHLLTLSKTPPSV
jgi:uncharacterized protein YlxW (UPF0749 family)